jgi:pimeloyl-ACP methyl ester carboxylesterase
MIALALLALLQAQAEPQPDNVKRIPPPGVPVPDADRAELEAGLKELAQEIDGLKGKPGDLLPDVRIYLEAVRVALTYNEFFNAKEIPVGKALLKQGLERARMLKDGKPAWATATGLVPRGYVSKIDGSVQPYGLVVPASYQPGAPGKFRLDFWFHGRGETLSELNFIDQRQKSPGEFAPPNTFVLHLYGRYCCANKLAGEIDLFEALESVRKRYPIDENRIVVRGFSMGGAACWQFATHFAGLWAAAAPGAGFSETADFLKVFQNEAVQPTEWEKKLWHQYDCTDYAVNLFNCPTVAYSGEKDRQKQAADIMARALAAEGIEMTHIIGPGTEHRYHPEAKLEINRRIDAIAARGRNPVPDKVRFTTWTLRYNEMLWVRIDAMGRHWERARLDAEIVDASTVKVTTQNVTAFTLTMPPGLCPLDNTRRPKLMIDGQALEGAAVQSDRSWDTKVFKQGAAWALGVPAAGLGKRHGFQGPIDDAFMDSFVFVTPTGKSANAKLEKWVSVEQPRAVEFWRRIMRGDARVVTDAAVTDADIASSNLVLWGDATSNKLIARIADKLPKLPATAENHIPVMIYPNPLNPKRYVVLNSGFTWQENAHLSNSRHVPILPDWAILDVDKPNTLKMSERVAAAGFFDEQWQVR